MPQTQFVPYGITQIFSFQSFTESLSLHPMSLIMGPGGCDDHNVIFLLVSIVVVFPKFVQQKFFRGGIIHYVRSKPQPKAPFLAFVAVLKKKSK